MAGRILIADGIATNRIVLKVKLAAAHYEVIQAGSVEDTLTLARMRAPQLVIADHALPGGGGTALSAGLRADARCRDIPLIVTAEANDIGAAVTYLSAGADDVLRKPLDEVLLLARVRSMMRSRGALQELREREETARDLGFAEVAAGFEAASGIGIVATTRERAVNLSAALRPHLRGRLSAVSRESALDSVDSGEGLDLFVLEALSRRPQDALRLMSELRSRTETRHAGIVVVHDRDDRDTAVMALDLGASDVVSDAASPEEIALRLQAARRLKSEKDRLRAALETGLRLAARDPLTGAYNRRYAFAHLRRIADRAALSGRPFAVMLLDIDRFKSVNDRYGHAAGDTVLVGVTRRIASQLRSADLLARIGGEEFLVAMPETDLTAARKAAERLRQVVAETPIDVAQSAGGIRATISIGVAMGGGRVRETDAGIEDLVADADAALYGAKHDGRNQVTVSLPAA